MRDGYSTNSRITGVLPNNATIKYDGAYCINGYRWITYIANNGQRCYIATGEVDKAGNRISSLVILAHFEKKVCKVSYEVN